MLTLTRLWAVVKTWMMPRAPSPRTPVPQAPVPHAPMPRAPMPHEEFHVLRQLLAVNEQQVHLLKHIMAAIDNLSAAVAKLQTAVDTAVSDITTPHPTDAQVQAAADAVSAQADRLTNAVASMQVPPPEPTPTPTT